MTSMGKINPNSHLYKELKEVLERVARAIEVLKLQAKAGDAVVQPVMTAVLAAAASVIEVVDEKIAEIIVAQAQAIVAVEKCYAAEGVKTFDESGKEVEVKKLEAGKPREAVVVQAKAEDVPEVAAKTEAVYDKFAELGLPVVTKTVESSNPAEEPVHFRAAYFPDNYKENRDLLTITSEQIRNLIFCIQQQASEGKLALKPENIFSEVVGAAPKERLLDVFQSERQNFISELENRISMPNTVCNPKSVLMLDNNVANREGGVVF